MPCLLATAQETGFFVFPLDNKPFEDILKAERKGTMANKIRYIVVFEDLSEDHPNWPNERVYYVKDTKTGLKSMSCYKVENKAQEVADQKNEGC